MKCPRSLSITFLIVLLLGCSTESNLSSKAKALSQTSLPWHVCFSPKGGCLQTIVDSLNQAKKSICVQAYTFTSDSVAEALVNAQKRGVKVAIILDRSQVRVKHGRVNYSIQSGIPVFIDAAHSIAHNKVMIIDEATVITGSFNFSTDAELYNAENLLIIQDRALAAQYTENWQKHKEHSQPYNVWFAADVVKVHRKGRVKPAQSPAQNLYSKFEDLKNK